MADLTSKVISSNFQRLLQIDSNEVQDGTGSATPLRLSGSSNVGIGTDPTDDASLVVSGDIRSTGDIIAENYIVSSSVTYMTQSFSSGSTIFGDTQDDIHQFTGSFRQSGSAGDNYILNGNVGIGTTTPGDTLPDSFASSTPKVVEIKSTTTSTDTGLLLRRSDGVIGLDIWNDGSGGDSFIDNRYNADTSNLNFRVKTNGTAVTAMVIGGDGNIGIGTTNPTKALQVTGDISASGDLAVTEVSASGQLFLTDATPTIQFYNSNVQIKRSSNDLLFRTNGATAMTLDSNRRLGIGNSEPPSTLTVGGDISASGFISAESHITASGNISSSGTLYGSDLSILPDGDVTVEIGRTKIHSSTTDYMYLSHFDNATSTNYAINQNSTGATSVNAKSGTTVSLKIANAEKLTVKADDVGIGTTSPDMKLHISSSDADILHLQRSTTGNSNIKYTNEYGSMYAGITGISNATVWGVGTTQDIGASGVFIVSGSNVGIGTTSPQTKLTVDRGNSDGSVIDIVTSNNRAKSINWAESDGTIKGRIRYYDDDSSEANDRLELGTVSDQDLLVLKDTSVGIGTTSPTEKLEVAGNISASGEIITEGNITASGKLILNSDSTAFPGGVGVVDFGLAVGGSISSSGHIYLADEDGHFHFGPYDEGFNITETGVADYRFYISASSGNVGIGTNRPTKKLVVAGDISASGDVFAQHGTGSFKYVGIGTTSPSSTLHIDGGDQTAIISDRDGNGSNIVLRRSGTQRMVLSVTNDTGKHAEIISSDDLLLNGTAGGNVGIGGIDPPQKLTVNGHISASGDIYLQDQNHIQFKDNGTRILHTDSVDLGNLAFYAGGQVPLILSHSNVGIGTGTPAEKLTVLGNISASGDLYVNKSIFFGNNDGDYSSDAMISSSGDVLQISDNGDVDIIVDKNGTTTDGVFAVKAHTGQNTKFMVSSSGNVGIGTTKPDSNLYILGDSGIRIRKDATAEGNSAGIRMGVHDSDIIKSAIQYVRKGTNGTGDIQFWVDSATDTNDVASGDVKMTISGSGEVGIGTTSPEALLHLHETGSNQFQLKLESTGSGGTGIQLIDNSTHGTTAFWYAQNNIVYFGNSDNEDIQIQTDNTTRIKIESDGKVGIGTTSPYAPLEVHSANAHEPSIVAGDNTPANGKTAFAIEYVGESGDYISTIGNQYSSADLTLGHGVKPHSGSMNTFVASMDNSAIGRGALTIGDSLRYYQSTGSAALALNESASLNLAFHILNLSTHQARIGIGDLETPATNLHISSSDGHGIRLGGGSPRMEITEETDKFQFQVVGTDYSTKPIYIGRVDGAHDVTISADRTIISGSVTASGDISASGGIFLQNFQVLSASANGAGTTLSASGDIFLDTGDDVYIRNSGANYVRFDGTNQNVLVGTSNTTGAKLTVSGSLLSLGGITSSGANLLVQNTVDGPGATSHGTSITIENLDTNLGSGDAIGSIVWKENDTSGGSPLETGKISMLFTDAGHESDMVFYTSASTALNPDGTKGIYERMRLTGGSGGNAFNLGINCQSPPEKLTVVGNIFASGSHEGTGRVGHITASGNISSSGYVSASAFAGDGTTLNVPDYVFETKYILKSLGEVEQHISESKHLPNIPSRDDREGWGSLSVGDRDMKLLEKVEELTLYVIDLQRQINELRNK